MFDIIIDILIFMGLAFGLGFGIAWGIQSVLHKRELAHLDRTWQINMASQKSKDISKS